MNDRNSILPPAVLGIVGGGQLGQMFAFKAREMGYGVAILEPDENAPAKTFANYHIVARYDDKKALNELARLSSVITTEFENVPADSLKYLSQFKPVYPHYKALEITQNRIKEKDFFNEIQIHTASYKAIISINDVEQIDESLFPGILKTASGGYDGKGQIQVNSKQELQLAFEKLNTSCILEKIVDLKMELSVVVSKNLFETEVFPVTENIHKNGILDISIAPARINDELTHRAQQYAIKIINHLDYIGVLAIEFFISKNNEILANEMAPRPHNSGHHTIESCMTSQFEQQIRSICNLKLGKTDLHTPSIMLNLLGDIYPNGNNPDWDKILSKYNNAKLHLYGKKIAKPGRKMGHVTLIGADREKLLQDIAQIKANLQEV
ncbi:MAG: 5-(carboxyamino)imidazole ribonucleotide synthase [Neisseriaceae bacterium]